MTTRMRSWGKLAVAAGAALLASGAAAVERVAVLEFACPPEHRQLAEIAAEKARTAAVEALPRGAYAVMTRESMQVLIRENGGRCEEGECEVETGRNIGASIIITGQLKVVGEVRLLLLKLFDTRSGTLLAGVDVRDRDDLALADRVPDAIARLAQSGLGLRAQGGRSAGADEGAILAGGGAVEAAPEEIVVEFASEPAGAVVHLDGQLLCERTPCSRRVVPGSHEVRMARERHREARQTIDLKRGSAVKLTLEPTYARLSVTTSPTGLGVKIGEKSAGKSPIEAKELDPGSVAVVIDDPCWLPDGQRIRLGVGETRSVAINARPRLAGMRVRLSAPSGDPVEGEVFEGDRKLGETGAVLQVPLCLGELTVRSPAGVWRGRPRLEEGKSAWVDARIAAAAGAPPSEPLAVAPVAAAAEPAPAPAPPAAGRNRLRLFAMTELSGAWFSGGWTPSARNSAPPVSNGGLRGRLRFTPVTLNVHDFSLYARAEYERSSEAGPGAPVRKLEGDLFASYRPLAFLTVWASYGRIGSGVEAVAEFTYDRPALGITGVIGLPDAWTMAATLEAARSTRTDEVLRNDDLVARLQIRKRTGLAWLPTFFAEAYYLHREALMDGLLVNTGTRMELRLGCELGTVVLNQAL